MYKLFIQIITVSVFFFVIGCKSGNSQTNEAAQEGKFSLIHADQNGSPVVGIVNMAYSDYPNKSDYPWCLSISIALDEKYVNSSKLPLKTESDTAYIMEDDFLAGIKKNTEAHFIGHLFNDSFLDIYIYLDNPEKAHNYLQTQINKEGLLRPFEYEIKEDPSWETVRKLFPKENE